ALVVARGVTTSSVTDVAQEFEVRWAVPNAMTSGSIGALIGAAVTSVPLLWHPSIAAGSATLIGVAAGALLGLAWSRDRLRRAETSAQVARVHALERSLLLKENRERAAAGNLEGSVVAGQFRIGTRMGSGASGVIYEAVRITDGTPVAIKLLRAAA